MAADPEITKLISAWQRGDQAAEGVLFEALYNRLRGIAEQCLRGEPRKQSLSPTGLVHEAYLRFRHANQLEVVDRHHFLALAARVMRRILVDRARARHTDKRGGDAVQTELLDGMLVSESDAEEILAVDQALEQLSQRSPRQAQLVELRFFGGFGEDEVAAALGTSVRTVRREWQLARIRLKEAMGGMGTVT
jgi:RNA polymerase sigma factor (TIGR02999 family)